MLTEENSRLRSWLEEAQFELRKLKRTLAEDSVSPQPGDPSEAVVRAALESVFDAVEQAERDLTGLGFLRASIASARAVTQDGFA